jgi:hypothetical protein
LSPAVVFQGLRSEAIPNLRNLQIFSEIRVHEAEKAFSAGNLKEAERLLREVDLFGERMLDADSMAIEKLIGLSFARRANRKLLELYTAAGRFEDARNTGSRAQELDERLTRFRDQVLARDAREPALQRAAILVQVFGAVGI